MPKFRFKLNGKSQELNVEEENDIQQLVFKTESAIMDLLKKGAYVMSDDDMKYLQSTIAVSITRDLLSHESIDLGAFDVQQKSDPDGGQDKTEDSEYVLINIENEEKLTRSYGPNQPTGVIAADIRELNNLGFDEDITLYQLENNERNEISSSMRVKELTGNIVYWDKNCCK